MTAAPDIITTETILNGVLDEVRGLVQRNELAGLSVAFSTGALRLATSSVRLGQEAALVESELKALARGGIIHDGGSILAPRGAPAAAPMVPVHELLIGRLHLEPGTASVAGLQALEAVRPVLRLHHERFDGRGFPEGLRGEAIPLPARIIAVTDTFTAMTRSRRFRAALPFDQACDMLLQDAGVRLDPDLVRLFLDRVAPAA